METHHCDIIVIGAGIAGTSVAAQLCDDAQVILLEAEAQPAYHATGRSAAMYAPSYGPTPIQKLTMASGAFFHHPQADFTQAPLLSPCNVLMIGTQHQQGALDEFMHICGGVDTLHRITAQDIVDIQPLLRAGYAASGILDTAASDIDVHALHSGFLRQFKQNGGVLHTATPVLSMQHKKGYWQVKSKNTEFTAKIVVNAAGAWAEEIGQMAGAEKIGLVPKRRTALMVSPPDGVVVDDLPMVIDIDEGFYLKPQGGQLLISPANEDPMPACDVQPDEMDIAICIDRIERAFALKIDRIASKWAGLRSFVADKSPVVGYSKQVEGFFWLAGQGGYGIQTSPAISLFARALILDNPLPESVVAEGVTPQMLCPSRLA